MGQIQPTTNTGDKKIGGMNVNEEQLRIKIYNLECDLEIAKRRLKKILKDKKEE